MLASRLAASEWLALGAAGLFLLSMTALDWFALSVANQAVPDSGGNAFDVLDGPDQLLLVAAVVAIAGLTARALGLVRGRREVAAVTGGAGLLAALVVAHVIISPPDVEASMLTSFAGGIDAGLEPRGGAFLGLVLAAGVVAGSALTILRAPGGPAPIQEHRLSPPVQAEPVPPPKVEARPPAPKPRPKPKPTPKRTAKPKPKRKPAARTSAAKPKPAARKRTAKPKPKPAARKRTTAKPKRAATPGRTSLATATAKDLVAVGFTPTQAERIVSYRDEEALVTKVADLKRVPGIAKPVLAELVKRLDD